MNERVTRDFALQGTRYSILNEWSNLRDTRTPFQIVAPIFACFRVEEEVMFLTNFANGLLYTANIRAEGRLSEITTDRICPTSIDFISSKASAGSKALVAFSSGCFIAFDPTIRRKESNQWYNTGESLYSKKPPVAIRWVTSVPSQFVVVFEDNSIWKFSTRYPTEDRRTAEKMLAALKDSPSIFQVVSSGNSTMNPLSLWKFKGSRIKDLRFVPSTAGPELHAIFAICTAEGKLLVCDLTKEVPLMVFKSYFAGFLTLAWSYDGRYIATGGEDDSVCVWSFQDCELTARGEEHRSWVASIAFDVDFSEADSTLYRIFSAGQDGRLVIWELSPMIPPLFERHSVPHLRRASHPPIEETHMMDSIANYKVSEDPLTAVAVERSNVIVGDTSGRIRHWISGPRSGSFH